MSKEIFDFIVSAILPLVAAILTIFVIPYIKSLIGAKNLQTFEEWSNLAVRCAEMVIKEKGKGKEKKEIVADFLNKMINSKKQILTDEQINVLIESAVKAMNSEKDVK